MEVISADLIPVYPRGQQIGGIYVNGTCGAPSTPHITL